jgi:hypothetical protein
MSGLLNISQWKSFLTICVVYVFHIMGPVLAIDVYFFDRDLDSGKLRFIHNNTCDICSEKIDITCLKPPSFLNSTDFPP